MSDSNFDDTELEDIMKEIEELEGSTVEVEEGAADTPDAKEAELPEETQEVIEDSKTDSGEQDLEDMIEAELQELNSIESVATTEDESPVEESTSETGVLGEMIEDVLSDTSINDSSESSEPVKTSLQTEIDEEVNKIKNNVVSIADEKPVEGQGERNMNDGKATPCEMNLKVSGDMKLNLDFVISGQKVDLFISEENGLEIVLENGARFSVPTQSKKAA